MTSIDEERGAGREFRRHIVRTLDAMDKRDDRQDQALIELAKEMRAMDAIHQRDIRNLLIGIILTVLGFLGALLT